MLSDALMERRGGKKQISAIFFAFQLAYMLIKSLLLLQSCFSDHKKASNLEAYVEWFNRLSYLVATEICMVSIEPQFTLKEEPWEENRAAITDSHIWEAQNENISGFIRNFND